MKLVKSGLLSALSYYFWTLFSQKSQISGKSLLIKSGLFSAKSGHFLPFCSKESYFGHSEKTDYLVTIWDNWEETLLPVV